MSNPFQCTNAEALAAYKTSIEREHNVIKCPCRKCVYTRIMATPDELDAMIETQYKNK